jgi:hypothetical protein
VHKKGDESATILSMADHGEGQKSNILADLWCHHIRVWRCGTAIVHKMAVSVFQKSTMANI